MAMPDRFSPIERETILADAPVTRAFLKGDFSKPEVLANLTALASPILDILDSEGLITDRDPKITIFMIVGYELGDMDKTNSFLPEIVTKYLETGWGKEMITDPEEASAVAMINLFVGAKARWYRRMQQYM